MAKGSASKKTRSSKKSETAAVVRPSRSARSPISWVRRFFYPKPLAMTAALATLWMVHPMLSRWLPRLEERPEYQVGAEQILLNPAPRWIPPDLVAQVLERAGFDGTDSLLDESLSERIAAAFYTHPWIENVRSVRKSFPARLNVEVVYREPVAMVKGVDGYYPIDRHGILLPPADFSVADIDRYPIIDRVSSVPVGNLGEPWGDPAVEGAAELATVLNNQNEQDDSWWKRLKIQSILVPRRVALSDSEDQLEYQLLTRGGSRILWGRAPGTQHPGELTVAQKLQRLNDYDQDFGGFDDAHGPWEIDIRPWHGIGRGLLAKETPSHQSVR